MPVNPNGYMKGIVGTRAQLLTQDEQLAGATTLSIETHNDEFNSDTFYIYCREHFAEWLTVLRFLSLEQQELLLSYYLLSKTQSSLALIWGSTQTIQSFAIRMTALLAGAFMLFGGPPTAAQMREILLPSGLEYKLDGVKLSQVIAKFAACRSFGKVAYKYDLHQPDIRRAMSHATKHLLRSDYTFNSLTLTGTPEETALGAYLYDLINKVSASGRGKSKRQLDKTSRCLVRNDLPPYLWAVSDGCIGPGLRAYVHHRLHQRRRRPVRLR